MRVLITGGKGYLGRKLYTHLKKGHNVTILTREDFDLSNSKAFSYWIENKYFEVVIHTAISGGNRLDLDDGSVYENNVKMFGNLLSRKNHYSRLISFGSGAELLCNKTNYGRSKSVIRELVNNNENFYNLRLYGVFGHDEPPYRFIRNNLTNYIKKDSLLLLSDRLMDFIHIDDLMKIVSYYMAEDNLEKEVDCVYRDKFYLSEILEIINSLSSHKSSILVKNKKYSSNYIGNYTDLPLEGLTNLQYSIKKTYEDLLYNIFG